jgi:hypothetical protein
MNKRMRRIATTGVCAVVASGALLGAGGSVMAATPRAAGHAPAATTLVDAGHRSFPRSIAYQRTDPWVADQLAVFSLPATERPAMSDPWIKDQLALVAPARS